MKLRFKEADVTIGNDSETAKKILQGFDYEFNDGKIVIKPDKKHYDIEGFEKKLKEKKVTKEETEEFLQEVVKIYKKIKYNIE